MKNNVLNSAAVVFAFSLMLVSCGTKRVVSDNSLSNVAEKDMNGDAETVKMNFLHKVFDNEVYASCITSKIKFNINTGSKDMTVAGSLKMKKDDVIRIQLTPLGLIEAGRIEFTKDYVLIVDRINKRYVKEDYSKVEFLQRNGLDFHALQALFWNQLYMPGQTRITESTLGKYTVAFNDDSKGTEISYKKGNMNYTWTAENKTAQLTNVDVTYNSTTQGKTSLNCSYGSFKPLLTKQFPTNITLNMASAAVKNNRTVSINLQLSSLGTDSDWETRTEVSSKYKQVTAEEALKMLTNM